jgi:hypothetical protein
MAAKGIMELSNEGGEYLSSLVRSKTTQAQIAQRAGIILLRSEGMTIDAIADKAGI